MYSIDRLWSDCHFSSSNFMVSMILHFKLSLNVYIARVEDLVFFKY